MENTVLPIFFALGGGLDGVPPHAQESVDQHTHDSSPLLVSDDLAGGEVYHVLGYIGGVVRYAL